MSISLPEFQREFWAENLPRYFKALSERFELYVRHDPLFRAISSDSDDPDLLLREFGNTAQVVDVVRQLMLLGIGDVRSITPESAESEQCSIDPSLDESSVKPLEAIYSSVLFNGQIRLIELPPAQPEDPISLRLFIADDTSHHSYEALSYVWGPRDSDMTVQVNGNPFDVSGNLAEALLCLRPDQGDVGRILWVDAICINQADNIEKSEQVAIMGDIYRKAKDVLIFLGGEKDDSALVMQYLKLEDVGQPELSTDPGAQDLNGSVGQEWAEEREMPLVLERIRLCNFDPVQLLHAADAFFKRPWWTRMWVVQEFALARKEPRWYCGNTWVSTAQVRERLVELFQYLIERTMPLTGDPALLADTDVDIGRQWGAMMRNRRHNISQLLKFEHDDWEYLLPFHLLYRLLYRESTDPRDRLFALREMLDPVSKGIFVPDYKATVENIFLKLSCYLLVSVEMRQQLYSTQELMQAPGLPSWVLDFSKPQSLTAIQFLASREGSASWTRRTRCPVVYNRILGTSGVVVDTVDRAYLLGDADHDMKTLAEFWRLEGLLQHQHPLEPLPECARLYVSEQFLIPFPSPTGDFEDTPLEVFTLMFPTTPSIPGFMQFMAWTSGIIPPTPHQLQPENMTCDKWKDSIGQIGSPTILGDLITAVQEIAGESFLGGVCFDRTNLEAQLLMVEPGGPRPIQPLRISDEKEYCPRYAHIKAVLSQAKDEEELQQLERLLNLVADISIRMINDSLNGRAPPGSQLIQSVRDDFASRRQEMLSLYEQIVESCSCSGEEKKQHQDTIERVTKAVEQGMANLQAQTEQSLSELGIYNMDSMETAGKVSLSVAKNFKSAFITRHGFVGFTLQKDSGVKPGDTVAVLEGIPQPVVLEEVGDEGEYRMRSLAHVIGISDIDLDRLVELGICMRKDFRIV